MTTPYVMPKLSFGKDDITPEELLAAETPQFKDKFFKPGAHTLKIKNVKYHNQNAKDDTWHCFEITFGLDNDERTQKTWLMVPFATARFTANGKSTLALYIKFREFAYAVGIENCDTKDLKQVVSTLFSELDSLVGTEVQLDIGYDRHYVQYVAKGEYRLYEKNGKDFTPKGEDLGTFPDSKSAVAEALNYSVVAQEFAGITKFHPAPKSEGNPFDE